MSEEQFWSMTPRQLVWGRERRRQEQEREEFLLAIQTSTLANHSFNPPKKAYKPFDFMPSKVNSEKTLKKKRFNRKAFAAQLSAMSRYSPRFVIQQPVPTPPAVS